MNFRKHAALPLLALAMTLPVMAQATLTALTAQMPEGRLYEVDMRLRPSGRAGPVATSLHSFTTYQETEAWTWDLDCRRGRPDPGELGRAPCRERVSGWV